LSESGNIVPAVTPPPAVKMWPNEPVDVDEPLTFPVAIKPAAVIVPEVESFALFFKNASSTFTVAVHLHILLLH